MCGCEPGFVCSRCAGTPDDPRREHEPEPPERILLWDEYPYGRALPPNHEPEPGYLA